MTGLWPEDFGAVRDGVTDDLTALTNWLNAVMTSEARRGYMRGGAYAVSGALPTINLSAVEIQGAGPSAAHNIPAGVVFGLGTTVIKKIGGAGGAMLTVAPIEGANNQHLDAVKIKGIAFDCNSLAAKGLVVQSVWNGEFHVAAREATDTAIELGCVDTLGETATLQRCHFRLSIRQVESAGACLRLKGTPTSNVSLNIFEYVDCNHKNGIAIIEENADNNRWLETRCFVFPGGAADYSLEMRGGPTSAESCRDERHWNLSANLPAVVRGTGIFAVGSQNNFIVTDSGNGTPDPTVETGATCVWETSDGVRKAAMFNRMVIADNEAQAHAEKAALTNESIRIYNAGASHMRLLDQHSNNWAIRIANANLTFQRFGGSGVVNFSNRLLVNSGGGASAPEYGFTSDPDTGIYNAFENQIGFATGGAIRLGLTNTTLNLASGVNLFLPAAGAISFDNNDVTITHSANQITLAGGNLNLASGNSLKVNGAQVVGGQGAAVADAAGGATVDAQARAAINTLLARLRAHGLIAT